MAGAGDAVPSRDRKDRVAGVIVVVAEVVTRLAVVGIETGAGVVRLIFVGNGLTRISYGVRLGCTLCYGVTTLDMIRIGGAHSSGSPIVGCVQTYTTKFLCHQLQGFQFTELLQLICKTQCEKENCMLNRDYKTRSAFNWAIGKRTTKDKQ